MNLLLAYSIIALVGTIIFMVAMHAKQKSHE